MERIILALQNKENRRLLQEWLSPKYEVKIAGSEEDVVNSFDLCIFDGLSLDKCWQKVQDKKKSILPIFQPFLLVTARKDVKLITRHLWQTVDEIILTPIQKIELQARVEMLLRARKYSLDALEKYYTLANNSLALVFILQNEVLVYANPGMRDLFQREVEEEKEFLDLIHPDDRDKVRTAENEIIQGHSSHQITARMLAGDTYRWMEMQLSPLSYLEESAILGIAVDITARKRANDELLRANRALDALSSCNHAIIHIQDESELLNEICRNIIEIGGYRLAWVGFAEDDENKTVHPMARAGFEEGYIETLNITWADTERGRGPTGTAVRTGQSCVIRNIQENGRFAPWRREAKMRGYASAIALPLKSDAKTIGALNIYSAKADAFDDNEVRLLTELADDLAFGITSIRTREARIRAESELEKSEERFKDLYENAPIAYFRVGIDRIIMSCNRRAVELSGYYCAELPGMTVLDLYDDGPEGKEKAQGIFARFKNGEIIRDEELLMRKKDGTPVWISLSLNPIKDGVGNIIESRSMVVDITEHKHVENINQARLRLLEFADSHTMDELLTASLDEIEAMTGSAIGFYHFLEPDQRTLTLQNWSTNTLKNMCTAEGKGGHYDIGEAGVWVECIDKGHPVVHNDYASLPNRKGLPEGHAPIIRELVVPIFKGKLIKAIIGVGNKSTDYTRDDIEIVSQLGDLSFDIAERKRAEEELVKYQEHLEELVEERAAEIIRINEELTQANLQLQEIDKLKSIFLASMSHELRTPLNSIIGFTGIMLMGITGELTEEQKKQLSMVKNSANHLLDLINDLLDISKIEAGKIEIKPNDFNFNEVVEDVLNTISTKVSEKGLTIVNNLESEIILHSDRRRVKQVLMNLAGNAVKFTESGSITITSEITADSNLQVNIQDTGMGIKAEDIKILFLPFQQIDMSSTKEFEGTGLGLYLCKKIVNLLGGDISAKSEFGKGSEFIFTIPLKYEGSHEKDISD